MGGAGRGQAGPGERVGGASRGWAGLERYDGWGLFDGGSAWSLLGGPFVHLGEADKKQAGLWPR